MVYLDKMDGLSDTILTENLTKAGHKAINLNTPGIGVDNDATITARQMRTVIEAVEKMDKRTVLLFHGLLKGMGMTEAAAYAEYNRTLSYKFAYDAVAGCPALAALLPTRITRKAEG